MKKHTKNFMHKKIQSIIIGWLITLSFPFGSIATEISEYPEIELYRQTLTLEKKLEYEQALASYQAEEKVEIPISKNIRLWERYKEIREMPEGTSGELSAKIYAFQLLSEDAAHKREKHMEMDCLFQAFMLAYWKDPRHYSKAFEIAIVLEKKLTEVTEKQYPDLRNAYFRLSEGYYLFREYEKSIELAKQAITDAPARFFTDLANLNGRKILAMCYGMIGKFDISKQYIFSTMQSSDIVLNRPVYNAVALSHYACDNMDQKNYRKAIALDMEVLEFLKQTDDYGHVAGMYACQCFCYFGLGEPEMVGQMADSCLAYAQRDTYNQNKRLKQAYSNLSRYNGVIGNVTKMQEYQDSLVAIYQREEALAASQYILHAGQEVSRRELQTREEKIDQQFALIITALLILIITITLLIIIYRLYKKKNTAYLALTARAIEWARENATIAEKTGEKEEESQTKEKDEVTQKDMEIMKLVESEINQKKAYKEPGLTAEILAARLGIHRNSLSHAINNITGDNFNQYLNSYRIKEAVKIISATNRNQLYIDELYEQVGFTNRTSFYRAFKKLTGLSPLEFQKKNILLMSEKDF